MKPCKRGHTSERRANGACKQCQRELDQTRNESRRAYHREYARLNKQKRAEYQTEYKALNRSYFASREAARRQVMQNPLSSIEQLLVDYYYEDAQRLTAETGIEHHVDHIWPLARGGPHLPWNLQVLTATENLQKGASLNGN